MVLMFGKCHKNRNICLNIFCRGSTLLSYPNVQPKATLRERASQCLLHLGYEMFCLDLSANPFLSTLLSKS